MENNNITTMLNGERKKELHISATPTKVLMDDKVNIIVRGLEPRKHVTVKASMFERKVEFVSYAHFIADDNGTVDLTRHESLGGTYTGIDDMGLFWSMVSGTGNGHRDRYKKQDVTTPTVVTISVWMQHLTFDDITTNKQRSPLSSTEIYRYYKSPDVKREIVRVGSVRGALFIPPGEGPFKAVIDMFGGAAGLIEHRSALLASRGIMSLALAYMGYDDIPMDFNLSIDYFEESCAFLNSHPLVKKDGIGVVGASKGGEISHMMASRCPCIKAVVVINGLPFLSYDAYKKEGVGNLPYVPVIDKRLIFTKEGLISNDCFLPKESDYLESWKHGASLLLIGSGNDLSLGLHHTCDFLDWMPKDKRKQYQFVKYAGAGHLVEPPYTPLCKSCYNKTAGKILLWGGSPKEHNIAQEDSWQRILTFLKTNL